MVPAYLRIRSMGVDIAEVSHEYWQMLILMGFYFCTAAIALYVSARHNARKTAKVENLQFNSETEIDIPSESI